MKVPLYCCGNSAPFYRLIKIVRATMSTLAAENRLVKDDKAVPEIEIDVEEQL
jgi:hypothetical protein